MPPPSPSPLPRPTLLALYGCFLLSGAAGLIYQTLWSQELALVLGASELAVATVLAAFMGGLALGAALAARWASRLARPVLAYALLELGIAASAALIRPGLALVRHTQVALLGGAEASPAVSLGFYLVASLALLLVPTMLMGATLPILTRPLVRTDAELGRGVGALYTVNTLGAALGALVGPFVLLPRFGLGGALWVAAAANLVTAGLALALGRRLHTRHPEVEASPAANLGGRAAFSWVLPALLLTGVVSFTWEILWTRLLTHLLGGSIYAFGTMLATYLLGLALGARLAFGWAGDRLSARRAFAWAQLGVAVASLGAFLSLDSWPGWLQAMGLGPGRLVAAGAWVSAATLLPGAVLLGATFPLGVRMVAEGAGEAARATGRCLAWNTVGAIAGALAGGFWLLPALGFSRLAGLAVATSLGLAAWAALAAPPRQRRLGVLATAGLVAALVWPPATPFHLLSWSALSGEQTGERVFLGVGRSATVLLLERSDGWRLLTNGLPESLILKPSASRGALEAAGWMSHLPSLLRPEARSMLVVGLGGGVVLEAVPASIEDIDVVEIEPQVLAANRVIAGQRARDPLADPRVHVRLDDARGTLLLARERYDAIVSQPSHPWTSASSHLFTDELFRLVHARLADDGVFVQWIGASFVDRELLASLLATLAGVFPEVELYQPGAGPSLLLVAAKRPLESVAAAGRVSGEGWGELGVRVPEDLLRDRLLTDEGVRAFSAGAAFNRDYRNLLQAKAPHLLGTRGLVGGGLEVLLPWDPLVLEPGAGLHRLYLVRRVLGAGHLRRAEGLARSLTDKVEIQVAQGWLALARNQRGPAENAFRDALALAPTDRDALLGLVSLYREALEEGRPLELEPRLTAAEDRAVVAAIRAAGRGDWGAVAASEDELAALSPYHPLREEATRLRVRERLAKPGAEAGRAALALLDAELASSDLPADRLLFAHAALAAGDTDGALARLGALVETAERQRRAPGWLGEVERLLKTIATDESAAILERLRRLRGT